METTYYKVLDSNGRACHGGWGGWHLPTGKRPGKWMPPIANPKLCVQGYHLVPIGSLLEWLDADNRRVYVAEGRGSVDGDRGKSAFEQARLLRRLAWNARIARLFACDCAERVAPLFEVGYPADRRLRTAIEVARKYAMGEATADGVADAAKAADAAAWEAAPAAWAAGWEAARAAGAADAAAWAADAAAWEAEAAAVWAAAAAAWAAEAAAVWAADAAAWERARAGEREWQAVRLLWYLEGN